MQVSSDMEFIELWEHASGKHPIDRALTLLSACSGEPVEELASLSIGERDTRLLHIYEGLFGPAIQAFAECPVCKEPLEYSLSTDTLASPAPEGAGRSLDFTDGQFSIRLRLPDSYDLGAISSCTDVDTAGKLLLERCLVEARLDQQLVLAEALPADVVEGIASTLAAVDSQADLLVDLTCCACAHRWQVIFDIERFLWTRITATVKRLLHEVHALASAYGWREADILLLNPTRRHIYMEMVWPTF